MDSDTPLNAALREFEAVEANLLKAERLWTDEIRPKIPSGVAFHGDEPGYDLACRQYETIVAALPEIDGWKPTNLPMPLNAIGQSRFDAMELGEPFADISIDEHIESPIRDLREYRFRFDQKRRELIRDSLVERMRSVDGRLQALQQRVQPPQGGNADVSGAEWDGLKEDIAQIHALLGSSVQRPARWGDLHRHLRFGMEGDLYDIIHFDWPAASVALRNSLYGENEPIPVETRDLGSLVSSKPKGAVSTRLHWDRLTEEDFERLLFTLLSTEQGYVNPQWLTRTNAPDRGRDLSVTRVMVDALSGTYHLRVILQCKHWQSKSVALPDVTEFIAQMRLWEPPRVDVAILATSGRFTTDAVSFIDKHNQSDSALRIEMWPESHLENLLAKKPGIIAQFKLR